MKNQNQVLPADIFDNIFQGIYRSLKRTISEDFDVGIGQPVFDKRSVTPACPEAAGAIPVYDACVEKYLVFKFNVQENLSEAIDSSEFTFAERPLVYRTDTSAGDSTHIPVKTIPVDRAIENARGAILFDIKTQCQIQYPGAVIVYYRNKTISVFTAGGEHLFNIVFSLMTPQEKCHGKAKNLRL